MNKKLIAAALLAAALMAPSAARAASATYAGHATGTKSGQARGLPILIGFQLSGSGCPSGAGCFSHAHVSKFNAVDWAYPDCPEVLDSGFEMPGSLPLDAETPHPFALSGSPPGEPQRHVQLAGRFAKDGIASGWFEVHEAGCTTGRIKWTARPE